MKSPKPQSGKQHVSRRSFDRTVATAVQHGAAPQCARLPASGSGSHSPCTAERPDHEPSSLIRTGSTLGGRSGQPNMFAHVTLKPGMTVTFAEMLGDVAPIFYEHRGWKLRGSYLQVDDATNSAIGFVGGAGYQRHRHESELVTGGPRLQEAAAGDARMCGWRSAAGDDQAACEACVGHITRPR